jgi:hypothetical protein
MARLTEFHRQHTDNAVDSGAGPGVACCRGHTVGHAEEGQPRSGSGAGRRKRDFYGVFRVSRVPA